jgi:YHS domain-containing protein
VKKAIVLLIMVAFISGGIMLSFGAKEGLAKSMFVANADNTVCPVTGKAISKDSKVKPSTIYNGKRYWFSSYAAVQEFKKNPGKYIKSLSQSTSSKATR